MDIERMIDGYIDCALWASTDDDGEPLDGLYGRADIADKSVEAMAATCRDFVASVGGLAVDIEPEQFGHDLWLTQNRHGAGFWDRGLGAEGDRLTELAHVQGEANLYVGDDGIVYLYGAE